MYFKTVNIGFLIIKIIAIEAFNNSGQFAKTEYFQPNSILYTLTTYAQSTEINSTCQDHLKQLQIEGLNKAAWALKMLDASGQSLPGFMFGQNYWLGDREICRAVQRPVKLLITKRHKRNMQWSILNETAPFQVAFYVAYLKHESPWQVEVKFLPTERLIHVGLCAPAACHVADLSLLIQQFIKRNLDEAHDRFELNPKLLNTRQLSSDWLPSSKFFRSPVFIFLACWTSITILLMLMAATLPRRLFQKKGTFYAFVQCFDVGVNAKKIFCIEGAEIPLINGLRTIVSMSIVSIHVIFFTFPAVTNQPMILAFIENNAMLAVHVVVDFFFTISGFLQAYKFLKDPLKLKSIKEGSILEVCKEFLKKLFHRWLRLAPLCYAIIFLQVLMVIYLHEVIVYHDMLRDDLCFPQDWWRYLIFIQNFVNVLKVVAPWTWSLACEMQFFFFGTWLLLLYAKKPDLARICFVALLAVNIFFYYNNGIRHEYGLNYDDIQPNINPMYFNPLVRCTSYLLGILCGWYLAAPERRFHLLTERIIGNLALVVILLLLFLLTDGTISNSALTISIVILARISLSLWISWLIAAAITNRKTWISPFLELGCFRQLARLSYAFYLIHPILITFISHTTNTGIHMNIGIMMILYFGFVCVSYGGAVICSLAYEIPYCNLSSLIIKKRI